MTADTKAPGESAHAFLVLDGLRGVAAISVMVYHYSIQAYAGEGFHPWLPNASLAVDFFFALSGFVIAYTYEKRLLSGQTIGQFLLRRLIRLYPLFLLGITLPVAVPIVKAMIGDDGLGQMQFSLSYFFSVFFLPTPPLFLRGNEVTLFPLDDPAWTLSLELLINFVFALICRHLTTPRLGALVFLGGIGLATALWSYGEPNLGWKWSTYAGGLARVTFSFFAGVLLFRFFCLQNRVKLSAWVGAALAAISLADFAFWHVGRLYSLLSCGILFPFIIWVGAETNVWQPARNIFSWLGKTSYAIYIVHVPLLTIYMDVARSIGLNFHARIYVSVVVCAILSLAVASLLDAAYDVPVRTYLSRKLLRIPNWSTTRANRSSIRTGG